MFVIGLAGGIASGKSLIASHFQSLGAEVLDADKIGHQVLMDPQVVREIESTWGDRVISEGQVDRKRIARLVFEDSSSGRLELQKLEAITHPRIRGEIQNRLEQFRCEQKIPACVLDAPVMFKTGWHEICDKIVFVDAPLELRQKRVAARGWAPEELFNREKSQTSIPQKRRLSTDYIDNSSTPAHSMQQVREMWIRWGLTIKHN